MWKACCFFSRFYASGPFTLFTVKGKWKKGLSIALTIVLIVVLFFAMIVSFIVLAWNAAMTETTDVGKYQRVLHLSNYPSTLIDKFPTEIPPTAREPVLYYQPAALQGGERFCLKFKADAKTIENYENEFSGKTEWEGKPSSTERKELSFSTFTPVGYDVLPDSFTVYLFYSEPYRDDDWNHGQIGLAAIDKTKSEVIFYAESW